MRKCQLCGKKFGPGQGSLFNVPKDVERRKLWTERCGVNFTPSGLVCFDHFSPSDVIISGRNKFLLPKAMPIILNNSIQR